MKKKTLLSLFLCVLMIVQVGCSKSKDSKEASNSTEQTHWYVEQELKEPELRDGERFFTLLIDDDGNAAYYSLFQGEKKEIWQYLLVNDNYEKKQITCFDEYLQGSGFKYQLCLGEDGLYYLLIQWFGDRGQGSETQTILSYSHLYRSNKERTSCEEVTPSSWNQEDSGNDTLKGTYAMNIQVTRNGILLCQENFQNEVLSYSLTDKKSIFDYELPTSNGHCVKENTLYYISLDTQEVRSLNCETGEAHQYPCEALQENSKIQVSKEGNLYLLDDNGIHRLAKDTMLWETVVDGGSNSMGIPTIDAIAFQVKNGEKEDYYVYYQSKVEGKDNLIACYKFDSTALPIVEKELFIYSLWDNTTLREAISQYQRDHLGVKINYLVATSDESGEILADQIKALNTEVLAGKGADIFLLDGLPMDSYIDKGVLLNISDIMMPKIEDGSLMSNIASDYVQDDAIYTMPIRFSFPIYTTREQIKETSLSLEQISQLADSIDKELFPIMSYKQLLQLFLFTHYSDLVSEHGELKEEEIKIFLNQVKTIAENIGIDGESKSIDNNSSNNMYKDKRLLELFKMDELQVLVPNVNMVMSYVSNLRTFLLCMACAADIEGGYHLVNNSYIPNGIIGINKASKETELAKDFIQYLFSEENQYVRVGDGFPMNTNAFDAWFSEEPITNKGLSGSASIGDDDGNTWQVVVECPTVEQSQALSTMVKQLTTPVNNNIYVMDMIVEEALPYLAGEKDIDTVCGNIINKVNLYLGE
jgi:hypothetical protein